MTASSPCFDDMYDSIEMIQNKSSDQCCTETTVASVESYFERTLITSLSEEVSPFSYSRTFGSNAAFRINSQIPAGGKLGDQNRDTFIDASDNISELATIENRRGVTLFRLDKMKELGLEHQLSRSNKIAPEEYGESSF